MTPETPRWFTSSYSDNGGQCVEVATNLAAPHGLVPIRDSKLQASPVLHLPTAAFSTFINSIKSSAPSTT